MAPNVSPVLHPEERTMKKFINRPENVVEEMLQGLAVLSPGMARLSGHKVMIRADVDRIRDRNLICVYSGHVNWNKRSSCHFSQRTWPSGMTNHYRRLWKRLRSIRRQGR